MLRTITNTYYMIIKAQLYEKKRREMLLQEDWAAEQKRRASIK